MSSFPAPKERSFLDAVISQIVQDSNNDRPVLEDNELQTNQTSD